MTDLDPVQEAIRLTQIALAAKESSNSDSVAEKLLRLCPQLAFEIALATEQAYRRGYQQGDLHGEGYTKQISEWRFDEQPQRERYSVSTPPPSDDLPWICSSVERLAMEHCGSPLIHELAQLATMQLHEND